MERYELARQGLVVNNTTGPFCFYADAQATIAALQAQLESANKLIHKKNCDLGRAETIVNDLQSQLTQRTAELERVRGERDEYAHKTKMLCLQNGPLMIENHDMKKLIAALPKVEGEILEQSDFAFVRYEHADGPLPEIPRCNQIALLQYRKKMKEY